MRLPLWRLLSGASLLLALVAVLLSLAPVYLAEFRFQRFLRQTVAGSGLDSLTEQALRQKLAGRARELSLPVDQNQVAITHPGGTTRVEMKYAVRRDFVLYHLDLHFHPAAFRETARP